MNNVELAAQIFSVIPKNSIGRYDLLPVFKEPDLSSKIITALSAPYMDNVDYVASPEAIGWLLGVSVARELSVGFLPLRKADKLPYSKDYLISNNYIDYSLKEKALEIKKDTLVAGSRILIVDEWIETGTSVRCCIDLLEKLYCEIVGIATIGINYKEQTKEWIDSGFVTFIGKDM